VRVVGFLRATNLAILSVFNSEAFYLFLYFMGKIILENAFAQRLMNWYAENHRDLPWRNTREPYIIWLSEIILQQTRVEQGLPYFLKFMDNFPNVRSLALAHEGEVMKNWQGLGYYSRARNLHAAAKYIAFDCGGEFPNTYSELLKLKGVGAYTAAAIASFAFNEAVPVVDGNVYRFISRYLGIGMPIGTTKAQAHFIAILKEWMPKEQAALFNQATMEFGALHCTPKQTKCMSCPFQLDCVAYQAKAVDNYPVKASKTKVKEVFYNFLIIEHHTKVWMTQRDDSGLWKRLWHFPLIETAYSMNAERLKIQVADLLLLDQSDLQLEIDWQTIHLLSHRKIQARFWTIKSKHAPNKNDIFGFSWSELEKLALPQLMVKYLQHREDVGK